MTRKDVVQTELNFLNIVISNVILGSIIGVAIYSLQSSSDELISIIAAILILSVISKILNWKYYEILMNWKNYLKYKIYKFLLYYLCPRNLGGEANW